MRINERRFQRSASHWAVSLQMGGSQQTAVSVSDMSTGKHAEFSQFGSGVVPTGVPFPFHNLAEESILHNPLISSLGIHVQTQIIRKHTTALQANSTNRTTNCYHLEHTCSSSMGMVQDDRKEKQKTTRSQAGMGNETMCWGKETN